MPRTIRPLTASEVETLVGLAAGNPGIGDAAALRAADPEGFIGAFVGGEMVAGISAVAYGLAFGFIDRRGEGHGKAVWEAGMVPGFSTTHMYKGGKPGNAPRRFSASRRSNWDDRGRHAEIIVLPGWSMRHGPMTWLPLQGDAFRGGLSNGWQGCPDRRRRRGNGSGDRTAFRR